MQNSLSITIFFLVFSVLIIPKIVIAKNSFQNKIYFERGLSENLKKVNLMDSILWKKGLHGSHQKKWFKFQDFPGISMKFKEFPGFLRSCTNNNNKISFLQNKSKQPVVY